MVKLRWESTKARRYFQFFLLCPPICIPPPKSEITLIVSNREVHEPKHISSWHRLCHSHKCDSYVPFRAPVSDRGEMCHITSHELWSGWNLQSLYSTEFIKELLKGCLNIEDRAKRLIENNICQRFACFPLPRWLCFWSQHLKQNYECSEFSGLICIYCIYSPW